MEGLTPTNPIPYITASFILALVMWGGYAWWLVSQRRELDAHLDVMKQDQASKVRSGIKDTRLG